MRVIFLGTPAYAAIALEALARDRRFEVVGVITQPDRPAGRSRTPQAPPVKLKALELGLAEAVIQPESLRDQATLERLAALAPDIGVVAAYGEILRKRALGIPRLGYVNIHPSLLPRYRGPSPVAGAILNGDAETGVTIMQLTAGMDAGPILAQRRVPLPPDARTGSLTIELFELGSALLVDTLVRYANGAIDPVPQDDSQATYTRLLSRADGAIDWRMPAEQIERMTRAYDPWPGAYTSWNGRQLKVVSAHVEHSQVDAPPGRLLDLAGAVAVATGAGLLVLEKVQPAGKGTMPADAWRRGARGCERFDLPGSAATAV